MYQVDAIKNARLKELEADNELLSKRLTDEVSRRTQAEAQCAEMREALELFYNPNDDCVCEKLPTPARPCCHCTAKSALSGKGWHRDGECQTRIWLERDGWKSPEEWAELKKQSEFHHAAVMNGDTPCRKKFEAEVKRREELEAQLAERDAQCAEMRAALEAVYATKDGFIPSREFKEAIKVIKDALSTDAGKGWHRDGECVSVEEYSQMEALRDQEHAEKCELQDRLEGWESDALREAKNVEYWKAQLAERDKQCAEMRAALRPFAEAVQGENVTYPDTTTRRYISDVSMSPWPLSDRMPSWWRAKQVYESTDAGKGWHKDEVCEARLKEALDTAADILKSSGWKTPEEWEELENDVKAWADRFGWLSPEGVAEVRAILLRAKEDPSGMSGPKAIIEALALLPETRKETNENHTL